MRVKILFAIIIFSIQFSFGQNVGIGTSSPNGAALLELKDSTRGLLIPRMKMSQRIAIASPTEGLMVYQTDSTKGFWYYSSGSWKYNTVKQGTIAGQMQYWNGTEWINIAPGEHGKSLYYCNGVPSWGPCSALLTTTNATDITSTSAVSGGTITNDGGSAVITRGICWSTSSNPTTSLSTKTTDGSGIGTFISSLSGLTYPNTYYVRSYATNSSSTAYGNQISFSTVQTISQPDLIISEISTAVNTDPLAGSKRSHYVELNNKTNGVLNLSNYAIGYYAVTDTSTLSNWIFSPSNYLTLSGSVAVNGCYVIGSNAADSATIFTKSNILWGTTSVASTDASIPLQLSGNSAIALLKKDPNGIYNLSGNNYKIIDVFGSPLVSRVTSTGTVSLRNNIMWTIAGELSDTRNRTFKRKSTVTAPTTDWNTSKGTTVDDSQWILSGSRAWDYTNIGLPTP